MGKRARQGRAIRLNEATDDQLACTEACRPQHRSERSGDGSEAAEALEAGDVLEVRSQQALGQRAVSRHLRRHGMVRGGARVVQSL